MLLDTDNILRVNNLTAAFQTDSGFLHAVDEVSFDLKPGTTLGIVGESGCGKSVTALSIIRLLPKPAGQYLGGQIMFKGTDILQLSADKLHQVRGNRISMIFQEPMTALNPVQTIGRQLAEVFQLHRPEMEKQNILIETINILKKVGIPDPEGRIGEYPHQISGGMRQRVMIAMALVCEPDILIADEPTTALDVTIQAQILELIKDLQHETGMSVIFITHDLGVIAEVCDDVVVMYAGKIMEKAQVSELFKNPKHPYSKGLLSSIPGLESIRKSQLNVISGMVPGLGEFPEGCRFRNRCPEAEEICEKQIPKLKETGEQHFSACHFSNRRQSDNGLLNKKKCHTFVSADNGSSTAEPCLTVKNLKMHFPLHGGIFKRKTGSVYAVDGVSFDIMRGETFGLVGESGCGKTTVGRSILKLYQPTNGQVFFDNKNILDLPSRELRPLRRKMQMIFQDPFESLNSRHTVGYILEEPFIIHGIGTPANRKKEVKSLLDRVGLPQNVTDRYPHEFSGGQRQRIGIARAIALKPELIICDEPVSALDVSIQSQILNLLVELQQEMKLSYLFIAHDLAVVKHISDHIAVMYLGQIVELTDADTIYQNPKHPYTQALISAIPIADPAVKKKKQVLTGDVPSPINPPEGCSFHTRCPKVMDRCKKDYPELLPQPSINGNTHLVACHLAM